MIEPDTKDWTWVLERRCPECGYDAASLALDDVGPALVDNACSWVEAVLPRADVRQRPDASTWSALEYACHVRDVFRLYRFRLDLMLTEDDPDFPNWDQDETAIADRYSEQDPSTVAAELTEAGWRPSDVSRRIRRPVASAPEKIASISRVVVPAARAAS